LLSPTGLPIKDLSGEAQYASALGAFGASLLS
jgi:hypothetical protein